MKYLVMEIHPAYAVLMGEDSRMVHAANLHYQVGQTVESPVLLREEQGARRRNFLTMKRGIAAAACLVLIAGAGAGYHRWNATAYTQIVVSAAADVRMDVSRSGRVLSVEALNPDGEALLSEYDCSGKDPSTVTSELIGRAVEGGYLQKGDTVHVYYEREKQQETYEDAVSQSIASYDLNADVREILPEETLPQPETALREEAVPTVAPPAPPVPPGEKVPGEKPPEPPSHEPGEKLPEPPARPEADAPAPEPAAPEHPVEEPPAPPVEGEPPAPPAVPEPEHPGPEAPPAPGELPAPVALAP